MHHSTRPATDVPEMGEEGGGTSPQGEGGRGWEIRPIWLIFSCTFNIVSCLGLLYRVHWLILY